MSRSLAAALLVSLLPGCGGECPPPPETRAFPAALDPFQGTLVFQSDRYGQLDLFLLFLNGPGRGRLLRLTDHPADDGGPAWSPGGDRIAFHSTRAGNADIYLIKADGTGLQRLTDHPADETSPSWSPDGRWIAFEAERDGSAEIYRAEVASGRVERLTRGMTRKLQAAYSPDGTRLAYMTKGIIRWQVALLDMATLESRTLTAAGGNCRPAWSPDGSLLALVSTRESRKADIWLMDLARGASWKLPTRPGAHNYDPAFSPDGRSLAFASTLERNPEQWDLYLTDLNDRNLVSLTSGPANDRFPAWRPDVSPGQSAS